MSTIEYVRQALLLCPLIEEAPDMRISFLGGSALQYSIEAEPGDAVVKRYLNGDSVRRAVFALLARRSVILDSDRAANAECFEQLAAWLEQRTRLREWPPMDNGCTARRLVAVGAPYVNERSDDGDTATYLMQLELTYYKLRGAG